MTTPGWALEVTRDDLTRTTLLELEVPEPAPGEAGGEADGGQAQHAPQDGDGSEEGRERDLDPVGKADQGSGGVEPGQPRAQRRPGGSHRLCAAGRTQPSQQTRRIAQ